MGEKEQKPREYYTETGITITHGVDGGGEAWIDTTKKALINRLVELGAKEVTEQPKDSHYRSFKVPKTWVRIQRPPEISEEERALRRERVPRRHCSTVQKEQTGP